LNIKVGYTLNRSVFCPEPLIHVGYPKTATTWLQDNVFCDERQGFISPWGHRSGIALDQFVLANPYEFDSKRAQSVFLEGLELAASQNLVPVISEETLLGDPCSGKYWGKIAADHIVRTFPEARILITLREQRAFILSAFKEYVLGGGTYSLQRFTGVVENSREGFEGICQLNALKYDLVVEHYQQLFGVENVSVLFVEKLSCEPKQFLQQLYQFAKVDSDFYPLTTNKRHIGYRGMTLNFKRICNRYVPHPDILQRMYPISWRVLSVCCKLSNRYVPEIYHKRAEDSLKTQVGEIVGNYYNDSNRRLLKLLKRDTLPESFTNVT
jgi:hypothetical protein